MPLPRANFSRTGNKAASQNAPRHIPCEMSHTNTTYASIQTLPGRGKLSRRNFPSASAWLTYFVPDPEAFSSSSGGRRSSLHSHRVTSLLRACTCARTETRGVRHIYRLPPPQRIHSKLQHNTDTRLLSLNRITPHV